MKELQRALQITMQATEDTMASLQALWQKLHAALTTANALDCETTVETAAMRAVQQQAMETVPSFLPGHDTDKCSWSAMQGIFPAMAEAATLEPEAAEDAASLYEKVSGMSPHQASMRAANAKISCPGSLFPAFFGLPDLETVTRLAAFCNVLQPYESSLLYRPLNEEEKKGLKAFADLMRNPEDADGTNSTGSEQTPSASSDSMDVDGISEEEEEDEDNSLDADDGAPDQDLNGPSMPAGTPIGRPFPQFERTRDKRGRKKVLSAVDCLLLVLYILRTGSTYQMASMAFGITQSQVSRYFTFGVQWLFGALKARDILYAKMHAAAPEEEVILEDM